MVVVVVITVVAMVAMVIGKNLITSSMTVVVMIGIRASYCIGSMISPLQSMLIDYDRLNQMMTDAMASVSVYSG